MMSSNVHVLLTCVGSDTMLMRSLCSLNYYLEVDDYQRFGVVRLQRIGVWIARLREPPLVTVLHQRLVISARFALNPNRDSNRNCSACKAGVQRK